MSQIELTIDEEFKHLIRPLRRKEYLQLESNLLEDGCRDPIITWNGIIVDGHNRYEICKKHDIPFSILEMEFDCREAVIAWICSNQLGRRNISEETRKFLIGMQYESEKIANSKRNARGRNQYNASDMTDPAETEQTFTQMSHKTAIRIADENHISHATVQKYATYTRALEQIGKKVPALVPKILSGQYKISHKNIIALSRLSEEEMRRVDRKLEHNSAPFIQYKKTRNALTTGRFEKTPEIDVSSEPTIKDMPAYDPDAEVSSLALTIPSWASSIERTRKVADLSVISENAKANLLEAIDELQEQIDRMRTAVEE